MPRELGDVLHYFMPELEPGPAPTPTAARRRVAVPLGGLDVVRAALVWNLAVELARQGVRADVVAPAQPDSASLWPQPGRGPLGVELHAVPASDAADLARAVGRLEDESGTDGFRLVAIPPEWLREPGGATPLLDWLLVLARPEDRELLGAYAAVKRAAKLGPGARLGVSVYGVESIAQAEHTFAVLAQAAELHLGRRLVSYGVLVDDLHLCRSIVTQRPLAVSHPRSPSARALGDVARLMLEDAGMARA